jgi:hypothetical protein
MTVLSDIIQAAFREGNIIAIGDVPTDAESTEAATILSNYIRSMFGHDLPIRFQDWAVPYPLSAANIMAKFPQEPLYKDNIKPNEDVYLYPPPGVRMLVSSTEETAKTLYLSYDPYDGARMAYADMGQDAALTISANGRYIEGASSVTISVAADGERNDARQWFYRADLGEWILILDSYASTDDSPLPPEFDDLFSTGLAIRLAGRFRKEVEPSTAARNADMMSKLRQRYRYVPIEVGQANEITKGVKFPADSSYGRPWERC